MTPTTSQLAATTRLFSSAVFRELAERGKSPRFARLMKEAGDLIERPGKATVADTFDAAFAVLKSVGLRDEYIYRAALTHKVLLGTHTLRTASMLCEFRAGTCKADLVILNGTATAYEIKSERDSLVRLATQIENYKKVFAVVNVIASEAHIDGVLKVVSPDVGVLSLSKRYQISVVREALNQPERICPLTVFESLRATEAVSILKALGEEVPSVPNTLRHAAMRGRFETLQPVKLHAQMVRTLKRSRNLAALDELVKGLPASLQPAALSIPVRKNCRQRLVDVVATPLETALGWA